MKRLSFLHVTLLAAALLLYGAQGAHSATCNLPMSLDYTLMDSIVLGRYFNEPIRKTTLVDEENGCRNVTLFDPAFSSENGQLVFETRVSIRFGKTLLGTCLSPIRWEGYAIFHLKPALDPKTWTLSFQAHDSRLFTLDGKPASLAGLAWKFAKDSVHAFISEIAIDLAPPVADLKSFLSSLFAGMDTTQALDMVSGLTAGPIAIESQGLKLTNSLRIPDHLLETAAKPEAELTREEIQAFTAMWEEWDTFLVSIFMALAEEPLIQEERQVLLDVLLTNRYAFISELEAPEATSDFVREQFMDTWKEIRPIFRRHLASGRNDGGSIMGYLAFFTASDALASLDALGPGLGLDISRDGFVRLVRLLVSEPPSGTAVKGAANPKLRFLLGMPDPEETAPVEEKTTINLESFFKQAAQRLLSFMAAPPSWAGQAVAIEASRMELINRWIYDPRRFDSFIKDINGLLKNKTDDALTAGKLPKNHHALFRTMVKATAWQESCFRQYIINKNNSPDYLRSYDNSSVGIMQINERVWKGLYDIEKLRWDIAYNVSAGCEILDIYFNRYALRYLKKVKDAASWTESQLAGSIYAMYNGGPREFHRYAKRFQRQRFYKSDRLFRQKLEWVKAGDWQKLDRCL